MSKKIYYMMIFCLPLVSCNDMPTCCIDIHTMYEDARKQSHIYYVAAEEARDSARYYELLGDTDSQKIYIDKLPQLERDDAYFLGRLHSYQSAWNICNGVSVDKADTWPLPYE